ncbi:hypothetical protein PPROV_001112400 [Pycnococcus provasolii]|uniref:Uncharacterized protein n=1 Tax=Pycnococcus provasolii TaxID=41880 RepID=A0A830I5N5_9CHLO|nr:hypothetical protein PPROV_001112400 [Pycnococcus provasolii]
MASLKRLGNPGNVQHDASEQQRARLMAEIAAKKRRDAEIRHQAYLDAKGGGGTPAARAPAPPANFDFNAPTPQRDAEKAAKMAEVAKARADIAARRQKEAEQRRQAWLAAREGAYAAAGDAHAQADTQAYTQAREQIKSVRRMEAKPKAFAAAGAAKAKADNAAYAKARADIQAIRQKDADARMRAFQEAKQGTGFATPPTPPPRDFSAPSRVQRVQIPAAAARAAAAAKARAELEVARQKAAEQRAHAFVQSCSERRSQAAVSAQHLTPRKSSKFRSLTPSRTVVAAASTHSNSSQQKSPHRENSSHVSGGSGGDERAFTPQKHAKKHVMEIDASNNAIAIKESALVPPSSDVDADTDTEDKVSTLEGKRDDAVTEEEVVVEEEEVDQQHETTNKQELESNAAADVVQDKHEEESPTPTQAHLHTVKLRQPTITAVGVVAEAATQEEKAAEDARAKLRILRQNLEEARTAEYAHASEVDAKVTRPSAFCKAIQEKVAILAKAIVEFGVPKPTVHVDTATLAAENAKEKAELLASRNMQAKKRLTHMNLVAYAKQQKQAEIRAKAFAVFQAGERDAMRAVDDGKKPNVELPGAYHPAAVAKTRSRAAIAVKPAEQKDREREAKQRSKAFDAFQAAGAPFATGVKPTAVKPTAVKPTAALPTKKRDAIVVDTTPPKEVAEAARLGFATFQARAQLEAVKVKEAESRAQSIITHIAIKSSQQQQKEIEAAALAAENAKARNQLQAAKVQEARERAKAFADAKERLADVPHMETESPATSPVKSQRTSLAELQAIRQKDLDERAKAFAEFKQELHFAKAFAAKEAVDDIPEESAAAAAILAADHAKARAKLQEAKANDAAERAKAFAQAKMVPKSHELDDCPDNSVGEKERDTSTYAMLNSTPIIEPVPVKMTAEQKAAEMAELEAAHASARAQIAEKRLEDKKQRAKAFTEARVTLPTTVAVPDPAPASTTTTSVEKTAEQKAAEMAELEAAHASARAQIAEKRLEDKKQRAKAFTEARVTLPTTVAVPDPAPASTTTTSVEKTAEQKAAEMAELEAAHASARAQIAEKRLEDKKQRAEAFTEARVTLPPTVAVPDPAPVLTTTTSVEKTAEMAELEAAHASARAQIAEKRLEDKKQRAKAFTEARVTLPPTVAVPDPAPASTTTTSVEKTAEQKAAEMAELEAAHASARAQIAEKRLEGKKQRAKAFTEARVTLPPTVAVPDPAPAPTAMTHAKQQETSEKRLL